MLGISILGSLQVWGYSTFASRMPASMMSNRFGTPQRKSKHQQPRQQQGNGIITPPNIHQKKNSIITSSRNIVKRGSCVAYDTGNPRRLNVHVAGWGEKTRIQYMHDIFDVQHQVDTNRLTSESMMRSASSPWTTWLHHQKRTRKRGISSMRSSFLPPHQTWADNANTVQQPRHPYWVFGSYPGCRRCKRTNSMILCSPSPGTELSDRIT